MLEQSICPKKELFAISDSATVHLGLTSVLMATMSIQIAFAVFTREFGRAASTGQGVAGRVSVGLRCHIGEGPSHSRCERGV